MKARIDAKREEGFESAASSRAQQKDAQRALKDRIASLRASMKASLPSKAKAKAKAKAKPKRTPPGSRSSTAVQAPQRHTTSLPQLPPSYVEHVRSRGTDGEFERRVAIDFHEGQKLDKPALTALLRDAVALNKSKTKN